MCFSLLMMIHLFSFNMQTQFVILLITPNLMDHIYISPNVNYKETPPATRNSINMIDIIDKTLLLQYKSESVLLNVREDSKKYFDIPGIAVLVQHVVFLWFVAAHHPGWFSKGWCLTSCRSSPPPECFVRWSLLAWYPIFCINLTHCYLFLSIRFHRRLLLPRMLGEISPPFPQQQCLTLEY